MIPNDLPNWTTWYHYFHTWSATGLWQKIYDEVRGWVRYQSGREAWTAANIDSQSFEAAQQPGVRGYDAGKKAVGRRRHILVGTFGFILLLRDSA